ncbi:hypothetical protein JCM3770_004705 [Rhodotorula araucariae]
MAADASAIFPQVGAVTANKKASPAKIRTVQVSEGWTLSENDEVIIVHAPTHVQKLKAHCSWLHQFEHSRYLHAGVSQGAIHWPSYPYRIRECIEYPHLERMHDYLSSLPSAAPVKRPDPSLWTEVPVCESKPELQAAFMQSSVHFMGSLAADKDRLVFRLSPPAAGMGSALYRRFGSDRFFRISLDDDLTKHVSPSLDGLSSSAAERFRSHVRTFFAHSLVIFGRQYLPFCWKDGAAVYWCESGEGIGTIPLVEFAQRYLQVELNGSMSVAKYAARFELGLTTTTPTVTFRRDQVLRTPDLNSDTLKISVAAMQAVCDQFRQKRPAHAKMLLPGSYVPSCIRGTVQQYPGSPPVSMVWQIDHSTLPTPRPSSTSSSAGAASPPGFFIQLRPFASEPSTPGRPVVRFSLEEKDGQKVSVVAPEGLRIDWKDGLAPVRAEEVVMTDGCSLMSLAAMRELADKYAASRRENELKPTVPCVAQGRIGPGKGVWAVAPNTPWSNDRWIEVRDSQWKFQDSQTQEFAFELHSVPSAGSGSKLGKQMFEVLAHCGVNPATFRAMLRQQIQTSQDAFWQSPSPAALLYHVEKSGGILEDRTTRARMASDPRSVKLNAGESGATAIEEEAGDAARVEATIGEFVHDRRLDPSSGAPNVIAEVVVEMLQAGFDPNNDPHLADKLRRVAKNCVQKQISFHIDDEYSRTAFVISDHLGVLEEGEFFFQTSEPIPVSDGYGCARSVTGPALLSRSPAVQPCDIQRATGVYCDEYRTFWDSFVVSAKGDRSLCSILSGRDYDGDKLLLMTSPHLVEAFDPSRASPSYADPPFSDSDWFTVDRRCVSDVVQPMIRRGDSAALASVFTEGLFLGTQFGMLNTFHTTLAYTLGLAHPLTREVGHLFCKALDGRKQGLSFSPEQWRAAKNKFAKPHPHRPEWTFCEDGARAPGGEKFAARRKELGTHPMDELVCEGRLALEKADERWTKWASQRAFQLDEDLAAEWRGAWAIALAERERIAPARSAYFDDLCAIRDHVRTMYTEYKALFQTWAGESDRRRRADALTKNPQASVAYLNPLEPIPEPPAHGSKPLLDRFQACASPFGRPLGHTVCETLSIEAVPSKVTMRGAAEVVLTNPAGDDVTMVDEESFGDGDIAWSQIPDDLTQTAVISVTSTSASSSQTAATTVAVSSSHSSAPPLSPAAAAASAPPSCSKYRGCPFSVLANKSAIRFCFDIAHRNVLGLKADALARRVHGAYPGAGGIMAPKVAPHILDVLQVSKRCAGITSSRTRVRPRTLLPPPADSDRAGSPTKKARWALTREPLEIHLESNDLVLRGFTGDDFEPATLNGELILNLAHATDLREVALVFTGAAKVTWRDSSTHHHDHPLFFHDFNFLNPSSHTNRVDAKKEHHHVHTLKAGRHVFPFSLTVPGSLPASLRTYSGTGVIEYKLKAIAQRPGFTAADWKARKVVRISRSFGADAVEFNQTLEIENTWPGKVMYSFTLPHKAYAAGDTIPVAVKFSPLAKGVRIVSLVTTIREHTTVYSKSSSHSEARDATVVKYNFVADGTHGPSTSGTSTPAPRIESSASLSSMGLMTPTTPGFATPIHSGARTPMGELGGAGGFPFAARSGRRARFQLGAEEEDDDEEHHTPQPAPEPTDEADEDDGQDTEVDVVVDVHVPIWTAPSHSVHPVFVNHKIKWSAFIKNPDGHVSELRCALPIHILSSCLQEEARLASAGSRNLLFGASGALAHSDVPQVDLPSYQDHVMDRVANAETAAQFSASSGFAPTPWSTRNTPTGTPGISPPASRPPSRPPSPDRRSSSHHSSFGGFGGFHALSTINNSASRRSSGAATPATSSPPPERVGDPEDHRNWYDSELLSTLNIGGDGGSPAHSNPSSRPGSRPPSRPSSRPSSRAGSRAPSPERTSRSDASSSIAMSPTPSTPATEERPSLSRSHTHTSGNFFNLHLPKPLRPLTAFSRNNSSNSLRDALHMSSGGSGSASDSRRGGAHVPNAGGELPSGAPSPSALSSALAAHAARAGPSGQVPRPPLQVDTPPSVVHTHPHMSNSGGASSPMSASPAQPSPVHSPQNAFRQVYGGAPPLLSPVLGGPHPTQPLGAGPGGVPVDFLSQVPSYDVAARGFLGGGITPLSFNPPGYEDVCASPGARKDGAEGGAGPHALQEGARDFASASAEGA